jgi:serine/threonine-protein kinase RsbW
VATVGGGEDMGLTHRHVFALVGGGSDSQGPGGPRAPGRWSACLGVRCAAEVVPLLERVASAMGAAGYPGQDVFAVRLALEEALVNALKHGHKNDPGKQVAVRYDVTGEHVVAQVEDEGPGFDPGAVPDPLAPENLEKSCGRGLLLMRHYLSWVRYNARGNAVTLCKRRSPG